MGRIKDLRQKVADGDATDEEKQELEELESEAAEDQDGGDGDEGDADVAEAADKLAKATMDKITPQIKAITDKLDKANAEVKDDRHESKFIVDKVLGRTTVEKLQEAKVEIPKRKALGKQVTSITRSTLHFLHALATKNVEKLQVLAEGTGESGGYLVPEEFANMIVEDRRDGNIMRQFADVIPVSTDTFHLPTLQGRPKAEWRAESGQKNTSTVQWGELVLTPYSLADIVVLTKELRSDAVLGLGGGDIANYVANLMATSLREAEEEAFWTGNGSGRPTGIDNYTLQTVDAGAGASDSARADAIVKAFRRLGQGYRGNAVWVANSTTLERVDTLKDSDGRYLLTELADGPTPTIKGRPVFEQNDLPGGKMFFGDFSFYKIADREGIEVSVSEEAVVRGRSLWERNEVGVRVEERVDGELALTAAVVEVANLGTP